MKYYSESFVDRVEVNLSTFVLGNMSVAEYEAGFNNMTRFILSVVGNNL